MLTKRLRIFAGPNGSGKTTLVELVKESGFHLGKYINADELKVQLNETHTFDFEKFGLSLDINCFLDVFKASTWFKKLNNDFFVHSISSESSILKIHWDTEINDYFAAFLADYLRNELLENCTKFSFETVMSDSTKIDFIKKAKEKGFCVYLYFVALSDPEMNKGRVLARVQAGGHDVPPGKIEERYYRTLDLLSEAIHLVDKGYFFDNTNSKPMLLAHLVDNNITIEKDINYIPAWFEKYVLNKL
jgi:predicted ABC-type ATPase